jgi:hypothetical protein
VLKKEYVKSKKLTKVTFALEQNELPDDQLIEEVHLVGDFNEWDLTATPLKRAKDGGYQVTLELEPDSTYEFRYVINGNYWCNDWAADDYVAGAYGADNCVVAVTNGLSG